MPLIAYLAPDGGERTVHVPAGTTVRDAALDNDIPGILGECGGNGECATCHVYVDEAQFAALPPMRDDEDEMLGFAASPRKDNSRLGCQITVDGTLDPLRVRVPDRQV